MPTGAVADRPPCHIMMVRDLSPSQTSLRGHPIRLGRRCARDASPRVTGVGERWCCGIPKVAALERDLADLQARMTRDRRRRTVTGISHSHRMHSITPDPQRRHRAERRQRVTDDRSKLLGDIYRLRGRNRLAPGQPLHLDTSQAQYIRAVVRSWMDRDPLGIRSHIKICRRVLSAAKRDHARDHADDDHRLRSSSRRRNAGRSESAASHRRAYRGRSRMLEASNARKQLCP